MGIPVTPNSQPLDDKSGWRTEWFQFMRQLPQFMCGSCAFADLPSDPTNPKASIPRLMIVTDALKAGESTGHGTGTLAYYANGWFRASDDTALAK